jgi:hypothetical protein
MNIIKHPVWILFWVFVYMRVHWMHLNNMYVMNTCTYMCHNNMCGTLCTLYMQLMHPN